jgi:hypothetical protein
MVHLHCRDGVAVSVPILAVAGFSATFSIVKERRTPRVKITAQMF